MSAPIGLAPRAQTGGVNRSILLGAVMAGVSSLAFQQPADLFSVSIGVGSATLAAGFVIRAIRLLTKDYRLRRDLAWLKQTSKQHGSARQATRAELDARGCADWRNGELLGIDDAEESVFRPTGAPFGLFDLTPGAGKTSALVIGSILHRAKLGYSVSVADPKQELSAMLAPALREQGIETWVLRFGGVGNVEINVYQRLLDAVHGDARARKDAV
jgi:type IV secretion system protein VirD4